MSSTDSSRCLFHDSMLQNLLSIVNNLYHDLSVIDHQINECLPVMQPPPGIYTPPFQLTPGIIYNASRPEFRVVPDHSNNVMGLVGTKVGHLQQFLFSINRNLSLNSKIPSFVMNNHSASSQQNSSVNATSFSAEPETWNHSRPSTSREPIYNGNQFNYNAPAAIIPYNCTCSLDQNQPVYWFCNTICHQLLQIQNQCQILRHTVATAINNVEVNLISQISKMQRAKTVINTKFDNVSALGQKGMSICSNIQVNIRSWSQNKQCSTPLISADILNSSSCSDQEPSILFPSVQGQLHFSSHKPQSSPASVHDSSSDQTYNSKMNSSATREANDQKNCPKPKNKFKKTAANIIKKLLPQKENNKVSPIDKPDGTVGPSSISVSSQRNLVDPLNTALSIINNQENVSSFQRSMSRSFCSQMMSSSTPVSQSSFGNTFVISSQQSVTPANCSNIESSKPVIASGSRLDFVDVASVQPIVSTPDPSQIIDRNRSIEKDFQQVHSAQLDVSTAENNQLFPLLSRSLATENLSAIPFRLPYFTKVDNYSDSRTSSITSKPSESVKSLINHIEKNFISSMSPKEDCQKSIAQLKEPSKVETSSMPPSKEQIDSCSTGLQSSHLEETSACNNSIHLANQTKSVPLTSPLPTIDATAASQSTVDSQASVKAAINGSKPCIVSNSPSKPLQKVSTSSTISSDEDTSRCDQPTVRMLSLPSALPSPDNDNSMLHTSVLKDIDASELEDILQDSFISMTTLTTISDDELQEQKDDDNMILLDQIFNSHFVNVSSFIQDCAITRSPIDTDNETQDMSTILYKYLDVSNPSHSPGNTSNQSCAAVSDMQDAPPLNQEQDVLTAEPATTHVADRTQSYKPENNKLQMVQYPVSDSTSDKQSTNHQSPVSPTKPPSPVRTRQSTRKRLFNATAMYKQADVTFNDFNALEDQPSARKHSKACICCESCITENKVSSGTTVPTDETMPCSPTTIASFIDHKYFGKKITNTYPAKNSRLIMQKLLRFKGLVPFGRVNDIGVKYFLEGASDISSDNYENYSSKQLHRYYLTDSNQDKPHLFARDLVFRVFALKDLYKCLHLNKVCIDVLDQHDMSAIKSATFEMFHMDEHVWKTKCIPQIAHSIKHIFYKKLNHPVFQRLIENRLL